MNRTHRIALLTALATGVCAPNALAVGEPIAKIRTSAQAVAGGYLVNPGGTVTYDTFGSDPGPTSDNIKKVELDLNGNGVYDFTSTDALAQASWTYQEVGIRTIKARVTNTAGKTGETSIRLRVNATPKPVLNFPATVAVGDSFVIDASATTDDDTALGYQFDTGDTNGTFGALQTQPQITHRFGTPGLRTIRVKVTDPFGLIGYLNKDITVRETSNSTPTPTPTPTTPGTTPTPTPTPAPVTSKVAFESPQARLIAKKVGVTLSCKGDTRCTGDLLIASRGKATFAPARFDIAPGASATVLISANKVARKRVRKNGKLATSATAANLSAPLSITR